MNPVHLAVLEIITANDGKFSWYQIDRVLSQRGVEGAWPAPGALMPILRELERSGCITATAGQNPAQPWYSISLAGQKQLQARSR